MNAGSVPAGAVRVAVRAVVAGHVQRRPPRPARRRAGGRGPAPRRARRAPSAGRPGRSGAARAAPRVVRQPPAARRRRRARDAGQVELEQRAGRARGRGGRAQRAAAKAAAPRPERLAACGTDVGATVLSTGAIGRKLPAVRRSAPVSARAVRAGAVQHDVVRADGVPEALADAVDQPLELGVRRTRPSCRSGRRSRGGGGRRWGRRARSRRCRPTSIRCTSPSCASSVERAVDAREPDGCAARRAGGRGSPGRSGSSPGGRAARAPRRGRRRRGARRAPARAARGRPRTSVISADGSANLCKRESFSVVSAPHALPSRSCSPPRSRCSLAACGEDEAAGPAASRSSPRRPRPPTSRATSAATASRSAACCAPNADPHDYEVRPERRRRRSPAPALVVRSGGDLDEWLADAIESAGADAPRGRPARARAPLGAATRATSTPRRTRGGARRGRGSTRTGGRTRATPSSRPRRSARRWWPRTRRAPRPTATAPPPTCASCARSTAPSPAASRACRRSAAQARHDPRRARLLRPPLRPRGRRRGDPVAVHAGAGVGRRPRRAGRHDPRASGVRGDLRRELRRRQGRGGDRAARPARASASRCGPTRSGPRARAGRPTPARSAPTRAAIVDGLGGGSGSARCPS